MPLSYPLLRTEIIVLMAEVLEHMRCNWKVYGLATWSAN